eukprot:8676700-Pyramimonas_sp.AAC.1
MASASAAAAAWAVGSRSVRCCLGGGLLKYLPTARCCCRPRAPPASALSLHSHRKQPHAAECVHPHSSHCSRPRAPPAPASRHSTPLRTIFTQY